MQFITNDIKDDSRCGPRTNHSDFEFELQTYLEESHGKKIHAVEFCHYLKDTIIFATCGGNLARIYTCRNDRQIELLYCYGDPSESEDYYTCCWSFDSNTSTPILIAAGLNRIIQIIHLAAMDCCTYILGGHGETINDLKIHPKNPSLLLSASKDYSIRLWNIQTDVCIAIFKGIQGFTVDVLSIDFDETGSRIATCGTDKTLKIWSLNKPSIQDAIRESASYIRSEGRQVFKTVKEYYPEYTVKDKHHQFVDCVKWMGDFILAKSEDDSVVCWKPGPLEENVIASVLHKFNYVGGGGLRFSMDITKSYMALGNSLGTTFVWKINGYEPANAIHLNHSLCTSMVRATAFSRDSKILISVCDDGTVWKWDRVTVDAA